jgi:MSHA biogenesis protein MshM
VYLAHFGLAEAPFAITPDTDFVYGGLQHQAAMNVLLLALAGGEGFVKLTGEVGTGKTLIGRRLLALLPADVVTAYVLNPRLTPSGLLHSIADELGLQRHHGADEKDLYRLIETELLGLAAEERRVVLCVDEAQALPTETLEALRLLSNLESGKRKLLQTVLIGQPELDRRLAEPALRSLASRVAFSARLQGLQRQEFGAYLQHRLAVAGWRGTPGFSAAARLLLWQASGGVPRRANILAHKALLLAYGQGVHRVGLRLAWAAVTDGVFLNWRGALA